MFNVRFRADGAFPLFRMPLTGIRGRVVGLDCVIGTRAHDFRDALLAAGTPAAD